MCWEGGGGGGILDCQTPCMGLEVAQFPSGLGAVPLKSLITTGAQHPFHIRYILYTGHSIGMGWWGCECGGEGCMHVKGGGRGGCMSVAICILFIAINPAT